MKNCEEMVGSLLERRKQYAAERRRKGKILVRAAASVGCVCLVALFGFNGWKNGWFNAAGPQIPDDMRTSGSETNVDDLFCGDYWIVDQKDPDNQTTAHNSGMHPSEATGTVPSVDDPVIPDGLDDKLGVVVVDGETYVQFQTDTGSYTVDVCLGAASDFEGTYRSDITDITGKVYTTKENPKVLIVRLSNGGVVALAKRVSNRIVINGIDGISSDRMYIALMCDDFVPMSDEELNDYFGIDIFPEVPEDLGEEWCIREGTQKGIYRRDGGTGEVYHDQQVLNWSNEDFSRTVNIELKKGGMPFQCFGVLTVEEEMSVIGGVEVFIGQNDDGIWLVEFMYKDVGFRMVTEGLTQEELVEVIESLIR